MGSSSSKQAKAAAKAAAQNANAPAQSSASAQPAPVPPPPQERLVPNIYANRVSRTGRPDLPFLGLVRDRDGAAGVSDKPRETRQEREARKAEKERQARLKEREKSLREEGIDGGYLVTLGVYTGPEDFSKPVVRQLQIERRLAPFWRGLNEHSDSWTEAQLVAAARGLPIPAPDEIPAHMVRTNSETSSFQHQSDVNVNGVTIPITSRSLSHDSATSGGAASPIFPTLSSSGPTASSTPSSSTAQLFRGRAKTLASLASGAKVSSSDLTPQEIQLPKDPNVNGQPVEAYLYKDAAECPICFMYYPPYLNKTRCCDQPICSECFVQIKRPDPHPPEHEQPGQQRPPEEEAELLVSEVASCPFCVTPEFGITYDPPPFRRGLAYAKRLGGNPLQNPTSAMSSSSSLHTPGRRRATSLSANDPLVITTDRVRPDWAKKLADARAHVLRRSAAATALHTAAYVLGNQGDGQLRTLPGFRRRRSLFVDSPTAGGNFIPRAVPGGVILSPYAAVTRLPGQERESGEGSDDITPPRGSSRRSRVDDIEELMIMEAIRLSLAAEEERKRKEEKDAKRDAKKKAKEEKQNAKQAEKLAKKGGASSLPQFQDDANDSSSSMARSSSNLGVTSPVPEEQLQGKGKQPAQDFSGFHPLTEPTSTLNTEMQDPDKSGIPLQSRQDTIDNATDDPQRHLEESRANLQPSSGVFLSEPSRLSPHARQLSETASMTSSTNESHSPAASLRGDSLVPSASGSGLDISSTGQGDAAQRSGTPPLEPMINFRSLTAMIEDEDRDGREGEHIEDAAGSKAEEELKEPSPTGSPRITPTTTAHGVESSRSRGNSGESSASPPPPVYGTDDDDRITPAPASLGVVHDVDSKAIGSIDVLDRVHTNAREATQ